MLHTLGSHVCVLVAMHGLEVKVTMIQALQYCYPHDQVRILFLLLATKCAPMLYT
jgi:hypothetical protein